MSFIPTFVLHNAMEVCPVNNAVIYSSYSNTVIGIGGVLQGTPCDARSEHHTKNKVFHVIEYSKGDKKFYAH